MMLGFGLASSPINRFHGGMTFARTFAVAFLIAAPVLSPCLADQVNLKNGRMITGLVREETDSRVIVDLGVGTMTIPRSSIASIQRSAPAEATRIRNSWEKKNFLNKKFVPAGLESTADGLRDLIAKRDSAVAAQQSLTAADAAEKKTQDQFVDLQNVVLTLNRKIAATKSTRENVEEYNRLIAQNNAAQAQLNLLGAELQKVRDSRKDAESTLSGYTTAMTAYGTAFRAKREEIVRAAADDKKQRFFEQADNVLRQYEGEFTSIRVSGTVSGGNTVVSVVLNDKVTGRFIVDTGAALTTLTDAMAAKLSLDMQSAATAAMTLADGKQVNARLVTLASVQVGDARLEHVSVAVFPYPPASDVDGLLGMNFLRHFVFSMQGPTGEITLKRFVPK